MRARFLNASIVFAITAGTGCPRATNVTCGAGTTEADGVCVGPAAPTPLVCGVGTAEVDGGCVPLDAGRPTTCGTGTVQIDGGCVPITHPTVTCGTGTREVNGVCSPIPRDAGPGPVDASQPQPPTCEPPCGLGNYCSVDLVCLATPRPASWSCYFESYRDGNTCDCACGAYDPDCADLTLTVTGCASGQCNTDGTCVACVPQCTGRQCGDNGCGGSCGLCSTPGLNRCANGTCVACAAQCSGRDCGDDGCGGSCGTCAEGLQCSQGLCLPPIASSSCVNVCGQIASDGCSCQGGCRESGTCCVDVSVCGCLPNCQDKVCGPDGCGGTCGGCLDDELCTAEQLCVDNPCDPNPCSSYGSCNPIDGSCACGPGYTGTACDACSPGFVGYPACVFDLCALSGESCFGHGSCVPQTGLCACNGQFGGARCDECAPDAGVYPNCGP